MPLSLAQGDYKPISRRIADMERRNCYTVLTPEPGAVSDAYVIGTPGIKEIATTGNIKQVNRGAHVKASKPYFVNGETVYRLDRIQNESGDTYNAVQLGIIPGDSRLSFADNGKQLMIVDPDTGNGWIIDEEEESVFQPITDPDFTANGNPKYVVFNDSFFICSTDTKRFIKSDANNGLSWFALDFGSAEEDPDDIVSPIIYKGELLIAGSETIQGFRNVGGAAGASFPYQANGVIITKGVFAPLSLVEINNSFAFVGGGTNESPAVWLSNGGDPQKISTMAIDHYLSTLSDDEVSKTFSYAYAESGSYFLCISFPEKTYCWDATSNLWHERLSVIKDAAGFVDPQRWRVNSLVAAYGLVLVGDSQTGKIGSLSLSYSKEYEELIRRDFTLLPLINGDLNPSAVSDIELLMDTGNGNFEVSPKIRLSWSDDGGNNYSDEIVRDLGLVGNYAKRVYWNRLGTFKTTRYIRFEYAEPFKFLVVVATIRARAGRRGRI